jgi:hypothetical protein
VGGAWQLLERWRNTARDTCIAIVQHKRKGAVQNIATSSPRPSPGFVLASPQSSVLDSEIIVMIILRNKAITNSAMPTPI